MRIKDFETLSRLIGGDVRKQRSVLKGQFHAYIMRRMRWHARRYYYRNRDTHVGETGANFQSFLTDIDNLGVIFNVQDKAAELKAYYQDYVAALQSDKRWAGKTTKMAEVSWIEDGMPVFGSAATESLQNEAFAMIGLDNINEDCDGSQVSIETIIAENPEVIVLFDYEGGPDMDEMIQSLYDNAALQDISTIKNKKVISLDFNAIYGGSGDLYTAMSDLADEFYGA